MLFMGPTGSGKTHLVEAAAETLFGDPSAIVKVDCAEFQHSHEIAKLIGSPPGYLGHRETPPLFTQENLNKNHTKRDPFTLILFDEIEKASHALWQLLLGVLDKATLTLGDNRRVDFSRAMIFMTSNLGAKEMEEISLGSLGFAPPASELLEDEEVDRRIYRAAMHAARLKFSPEFMNRIDKVVVFRRLKENEIKQIVDIELGALQRRIAEGTGPQFTFALSDQAKDFLLAEGMDPHYGARHLKRAIERFLAYPLAHLVSSEQVRSGDSVLIDFDGLTNKLTFSRANPLAETVPPPLAMVPPLQSNNGDCGLAA